ncbi:unnamed protein product, partial [marine sediment metagenome]
VKALLAKAKQSKKIAQKKKKGSPAASPKKMDILLDKIEGLIKRQDRLESVYTKGVVTATGSPGSGKKVSDHENQATKTNEQVLKEVELEQERAQGKQKQPGQQPGQPQQQLTPEQYEALSPEKKVPILEAQLQQKQGGQFQGQPQQRIGKLTGQQALYGLIEIIKATGPTIQTAIAKGGSNSDNPLKIFLDQMKTYESIEQGAIGRFFNYMKMLSPGQREKTMDNIATSGPGNVQIPKTDDGRIKA